MPTLYEQIDEEAKALDATPDIGDDDENNDGSNDESKPGGDAGEPAKDPSPDDGGGTPEDARPAPEPSPEPQKAEQPPQEDGEDLLKQPTNADWVKNRRELRELKAKLALLEKPPEPPKQEPKPEVVAKPAEPEIAKEPDKTTDYQGWLEWKLAQSDMTLKEQAKIIEDVKTWREESTKVKEAESTIQTAIQEFTTIEETYKAANPDYLPAIQFARSKYADSIKTLYPNMSQRQIETAIDQQILQFASDSATKGLNPAEELFDMAIERFGWVKEQPKPEETPAEKPKLVEKPNLKVISNNRKKSASPLAGGGQGGTIPLTQEAAADMSLGEFAQLSPAELAALEA